MHRPSAVYLLELTKAHGAAIHDAYGVGYGKHLHTISCSKHWQKSVKWMVLDMALAQEDRESTPGWSRSRHIIYHQARSEKEREGRKKG